MEKTELTEDELNVMSYQELRRLSILFRLPANIKKEYMVKMIQAHQDGDETTKKAIEKKVKQDREYRRLNAKITNKQRGKSSLMFSRQSTQQVPTDLSVASKHEYYSYVAHYTAKENPEGISEIIKEEAEVSRRNNRNGGIIHQTRKSTRKLSALGKREIMLPRNHSLTTPVRLMPQHERNFVSSTNGIPSSSSSVGAIDSNWSNNPNVHYEPISSPSESEDHFQEGSGNTYAFGTLPISGEYPNFLASSTSHELYRSQPSYWHTRENCASSSGPIISNVFSSSSTITNPSDLCQASLKNPGFQQETFKKYIRYNNNPSEREFSGCDETKINSSKQNDFGDYVRSRLDENSSIGGSESCEQQFQLSRDGNSVIRHTNNQSEPFVMDIYLSKTEETGGFLRVENGSVYPPEMNLFESTETKNGNDGNTSESQERNPTWDKGEEDEDDDDDDDGDAECFDEKETRKRKCSDEIQKSDSFSSDMSIVSSLSDSSKEVSEEDGTPKLSNALKCRYSFGHNQYPDLSNKSSDDEEKNPLPPFITLLSSINHDFGGYSTCRNSFTGTTPIHLHPIMTSNHAGNYNVYPNLKAWSGSDLENGRSQSPQELSSNNANIHVFPRWLYTYQEPESPYSNDGNGYSAWNDTGENGGKLMQILCRRHGCHVYPLPGNHQQHQ